MRLWTEQTTDFDITSQVADFRKSSYLKDDRFPNYEQAYIKLLGELIKRSVGSSEIKPIWCFLSKPDPEHVTSGNNLYELNVPDKKIVEYICDCVWIKIITNCWEYRKNNNRRSKCYDEWVNKNGFDYANEQQQKCNSKEDEKELWRRVFWPDAVSIPCPVGIKIPKGKKLEMCSALIPSPINRKWVVKKEIIHNGYEK